MRYLAILTFVLGVFSMSGAASAQETDHETQAGRETTHWSVGAGVGWTVVGSRGYMTGMSSFDSLGPMSPSTILVIERRLSERAHLLFDVGGTYSSYDNNDNYEHRVSRMTIDENDMSAWAGLGLRWVFNPQGVVTVSGIITMQAGWAKNQAHSFDTSYEDDGTETTIRTDYTGVAYSFGPQLGVALERELLDNLYLRFESNLLGASWQKRTLDEKPEDETTTTSKRSSFTAGLAFAPFIQLRLLI